MSRDLDQLDPLEYAKRILAAENSFEGFVRLMHPNWVIPDFHLEMISVLDRLEKGQLKHPETGNVVRKVMFNAPPRHSKSTIATELFAAYYMLRNSKRKVMTGSYSAALAEGFGQRVKDYYRNPMSAQAFPDAQVNPANRAREDWGLVDKEGVVLPGKYFAVGLAGVTTGRGANLLIIDDPVKTKQEADSVVTRTKVNDFYDFSLKTRLEPTEDGEEPIEIAVMTRWHPDDLSGHIMQSDEWRTGEWYHVSYPAILDEGLPTERALWEVRFPLAKHKKLQAQNRRVFQALFQQTPFIDGGNLVKSRWWQFYDKPPEPEDIVVMVAGVDTAFKAGASNDRSVFVFGCLTKSGDYYITHVQAGRWEFPDLQRQFVTLNALMKGKAFRGFYIEDKASGQSMLQVLRKMPGIVVIPHKMSGDKETKVNVVTPLIEGGRVWLPRNAPWLDEFVNECEQFPNGSHDDRVDALVIVLDTLSRMQSPDHSVGFSQGMSINKMISSGMLKVDKDKVWKGFGVI